MFILIIYSHYQISCQVNLSMYVSDQPKRPEKPQGINLEGQDQQSNRSENNNTEVAPADVTGQDIVEQKPKGDAGQ